MEMAAAAEIAGAVAAVIGAETAGAAAASVEAATEIEQVNNFYTLYANGQGYPHLGRFFIWCEWFESVEVTDWILSFWILYWRKKNFLLPLDDHQIKQIKNTNRG